MLVVNKLVLLGGLEEVIVGYRAVEEFDEEMGVDGMTVEGSAEGSAGGSDEVSGAREDDSVGGQ